MNIKLLTGYNHTDSINKPTLLKDRTCNKYATLLNTADTVDFGSAKDISVVGKRFKNKIKIVFSDIDGTISISDDNLTGKTLTAINQLHQKGIPVILTTARCYKDTTQIIDQFKHKPDYTILLQGGEIIDKNGNVLLKNKIPDESGKKLIDWVNSLNEEKINSQLIMYFDDEAYSIGNVKFPWQTNCQIIKINSFDNLFANNKTLQKAMLYSTDKDFFLNGLISSFNTANIRDLDLKPSMSGFHEIQNKSVSKDKAINFILEKLEISPRNTMVIGDSSNDIEMLDFISNRNGLAIAMGNADSNVKRHANAVTKDIEQEGFFNAISHIFF